ncbi:MAG: LPS assembly lipoprotein LptE [Wenzhouxiangellaceae bacterium]|nr:LPS assembly lipoprotein LptE [Wenzhouxiangellaceae bacterium]
MSRFFTSRPAWLALLVFVLGSLSACGFQLRGAASLPEAMQKTWLQPADPTSPFTRELELLLRANGVELVDQPGEEAATLRITRERITRRALTISGDARVREFELVFDLRFTLVAPGGDVLLDSESLRLQRDFQFDEQEILSAASEEELIRENLRREMAAALIRRLEAFGRT